VSHPTDILRPLVADGINLPLVLGYGLIVLAPLGLFEVALEGWILSRVWAISFKALARPVLIANGWSLLAGIPIKILNALIYSWVLPKDLPGFFARYPLAISLGTLNYFVITVIVEAAYFFRRLKGSELEQQRSKVWRAVLLANLATYAVLGPLHYFGTRPTSDIKEFTGNTAWAIQPPTQIVYIDSRNKHLKVIYSDGLNGRTLVPMQVTNYLVTSDFDKILVQDPGGARHFWRYENGKMKEAEPNTAIFAPAETTYGPGDQDRWTGEDSINGWQAWAEPGLGNSLRVFQTNALRSSWIWLAVNPGLLHLADFSYHFEHPSLISGGRECLFQCENSIYLLDIQPRRVGKLADGRDFILLTPRYRKAP
jgi:hypothetical protein